MKKIILMASAFTLLGTSAFAAETTFNSTGAAPAVVAGSVLAGFRASKEVEVVCNANTAQYSVVSDHKNGARIFASASGSPLIYFSEKTATQVGSNVGAGKVSKSDSSEFSSWSTL